MIKIKRIDNTKINILFLFLDILIIEYLAMSHNLDLITLYIAIRVIILSLSTLKILFNIMIILFNFFNEIKLMIDELNITEYLTQFKSNFLFFVEVVILISLWQTTLYNCRTLLFLTNSKYILISIVLIDISFLLINNYISGRYKYLSYEKNPR